MLTAITGGSLQRTDDGTLLAVLTTRANHQLHQDLNELLGLDILELKSTGSVLSSDPRAPTLFESGFQATIPSGAKLFDFTTSRPVAAPFEITFTVTSNVRGVLENHVFSGEQEVRIKTGDSPLQIDAATRGRFEINLA